MRRLLLITFFISSVFQVIAGTITGIVSDDKGKPLPYASISIKGTNKGTTSNSTGKYSIILTPGEYTLVCQYVGYGRSEKKIIVANDDQSINFTLSIQELTLGEVVVKRGEDPAYEIIRQAIKKRDYYNNQVDSFSVNVYIKGMIRSGAIPKRVMGIKIEREDNDGLDSLGKGIVFLSESITQVEYAKPNKIKFRVISSRESGGGYGLSFPFFINFYQNNVSIFDNNLNPRGFISPIADGAFNYYKYKYEGSFVEEGVMVNTIRVTPRRQNEPLFTGTIHIAEDDWRIFSLDLFTTKHNQLELLDTLRVTQLHAPVQSDTWKTKNQVLSFVFRQFGFHMSGGFVNVYTDYNINPGFAKKHFGRTIMKFDTAFNKKDTNYWNKIRPVALELDERRDFVFKDSLSKAQSDSFRSHRFLDSLRRKQKPVTLIGILWSGQSHNFYSKRSTLYWTLKPLITQVEYNTVEGVSVNVEQNFRLNKAKSKNNYDLNWNTRYGFSNTHLNSYGQLRISPRKYDYRNRYFQLAGGKRLSQFNHDSPIDPFSNALYTLLGRKNYMKLYENWFGSFAYNNRMDNGLQFRINTTYENRIPLENTTDFSFFNKEGRAFLPNHPYELAAMPFEKHQALVANVEVSWQPGQHYIEYPNRKMPVGSKAPTFTVEYAKGIHKLFGSDVDFDRWQFTVNDKMNFKMGGEFHYRIGMGGFLNSKQVQIPDLKHFNGNQTFYNIKYLNSFQLAPYYRYSNAENFYVFGHAEHHFNGLLTNKIPLFNKLKWTLVGGANTFFVDKNNYYAEVFVGLENIFKIFRLDVVTAYQPGLGNQYGVRIGFGGLIGGKVQLKN
jgi:hypothetical protein